jgi:hypothetical protein
VGGIVVDAFNIGAALLLGGGLALASALLMGVAGGPGTEPVTVPASGAAGVSARS